MKPTPSPPRLKNYMYVRDRRDDGVEWIRAERIDPETLERPVCVVNGVFDILHSGHMKLLFHAREHCKTLIVAMNSDRMVRDLKGPSRPVLNWIERATALGYTPIDLLCEFDSETELRDLLNRVRPDFRVQGGEYKDQHTKYPWLQKLYVRSDGMRTSEIIRRIQKSYESTKTN